MKELYTCSKCGKKKEAEHFNGSDNVCYTCLENEWNNLPVDIQYFCESKVNKYKKILLYIPVILQIISLVIFAFIFKNIHEQYGNRTLKLTGTMLHLLQRETKEYKIQIMNSKTYKDNEEFAKEWEEEQKCYDLNAKKPKNK